MKNNFFGNQYTKNLIGIIGRFMTKWLKRIGWSCVIAWALVGALKFGQHYFPENKIVYAQVTVKDTTLSPVMQRIEQCESTNRQKGKDGQVIVHINKDGTYDMGKFEINSTWNATATKMGYDLTNENDNQAFAVWIYENRGTGDWYSSSNCWNK